MTDKIEINTPEYDEYWKLQHKEMNNELCVYRTQEEFNNYFLNKIGNVEQLPELNCFNTPFEELHNSIGKIKNLKIELFDYREYILEPENKPVMK
jgi:hypothetical protein